MQTLFKTLPLALCLCAAASNAVAATDKDELKKELKIMSSVMDTAFKQSDRRSPIRIRATETTYLANQGVVFTFATAGSDRSIFIDLDGIRDLMPSAPLPPNFIFSNEGDFEFHVDHEWEEFAHESAEHIREAMREAADTLRDLRSEERNVSWEHRELERRVRDIEFRLRNVSGDEKKHAEQELAEVREQLEKSKSRQSEVQQYVEKFEAEQKQKQQERIAAREKVMNQFLSDFESQAGDILCRFGNGLRALDDKENVTLILENIKTTETGKADRIYVFNQQNIKRCVQAKIDTNELLTSATVYEF